MHTQHWFIYSVDSKAGGRRVQTLHLPVNQTALAFQSGLMHEFNALLKMLNSAEGKETDYVNFMQFFRENPCEGCCKEILC